MTDLNIMLGIFMLIVVFTVAVGSYVNRKDGSKHKSA